MTVRTDELTLIVGEVASETLVKMGEHAILVAQAWRHVDPELAMKGVTSLARQVTMLFARGFGNETLIARDGELSLYVSTPTIVFGLIFHPDRRPDTPLDTDVRLHTKAPLEGRFCMEPTEAGYCGSPIVSCERTCDHAPGAPRYILPVPGGWSFHS